MEEKDFSTGCDWEKAAGGRQQATEISTAKLRRAMRKIAAKQGDFTVFGLVMRADDPGSWDLVVSAPCMRPHPTVAAAPKA